MGTGHSPGLLSRTDIGTTPDEHAPTTLLQSRARQADLRDQRAPTKRSSHKGGKSTEGVLLYTVSGSKERRGPEARDKPESTELLCGDPPLQDGGHPYNEGIAEARRLASKGGSKGCLLHDSDPPESQAIPQVPVSGRVVRVHLPTLWPLIGTMGLYQDPETSSSSAEEVGGEVGDIYRRHAGNGRAPGHVTGPNSRCDLPVGVPGFHNKLQEVGPSPNKEDRIPWHYGGYHPNGSEPAPREDEKNPCGGSEVTRGGDSIGTSPGMLDRENECSFPSNSTSPTVLSGPTDEPISCSGGESSELRDSVVSLTRQLGGAGMVGHPDEEVEWQGPNKEGCRPDHRVRCFTDRLGSSLWPTTDRRSMVSTGEADAHKLPGAAGSHSSNSHLCKRQSGYRSAAEDRQHDSSCIHKQPGRYSLQEPGNISKEPLDVMPGKEHSHHSSTPARCIQPDCRCRVTDIVRLVRLEAGSGDIQQDRPAVWTNRDRSICLQTDQPVQTLFQLAARSIRSSYRRIPTGLVEVERVCEPSMESDRQGPVTNPVSECPGNSDSTSVGHPALVPNPPGHASRPATPITPESVPTRDVPPTSRVEHLRKRFRDQNLSEKATDLVLKSWRSKTNKSYDSLFGRWHRWCDQQGADPFSGPISAVANFLASLFEEGYQYNSVNAYRSAISSVHEKVDGVDVGQHPTITRLLKGVFNDRPPLPRYSSTWNVQTVLDYIKSLNDAKQQSLVSVQ